MLIGGSKYLKVFFLGRGVEFVGQADSLPVSVPLMSLLREIVKYFVVPLQM